MELCLSFHRNRTIGFVYFYKNCVYWNVYMHWKKSKWIIILYRIEPKKQTLWCMWIYLLIMKFVEKQSTEVLCTPVFVLVIQTQLLDDIKNSSFLYLIISALTIMIWIIIFAQLSNCLSIVSFFSTFINQPFQG